MRLLLILALVASPLLVKAEGGHGEGAHGEGAHGQGAHGKDAHDAAPEVAPAAPTSTKARPAKKKAEPKPDADGTFTIDLRDGDSDHPAPESAPKTKAHDEHEAAPAKKAQDEHGKPTTHTTHVDEDDDLDAVEDEAKPSAKPPARPRVKRRDWKPLTGTGSPDSRRSKWGVVEVHVPRLAAFERMKVRGDELIFSGEIAFRHDSIRFEVGADAVLVKVAEALQASPELERIWIEGHADASGAPAYNQKLSEARASAVREALVKLGVAPERLLAYGKGEGSGLMATPRAKPDPLTRRVVFRMVKADRSALLKRRKLEVGSAAVIGVQGDVRWRLAPEPAKTGELRPGALPASALASNEHAAGGHAEGGQAKGGHVDEAKGGHVEAEAPTADDGHAAPEPVWSPVTFRQHLPEGTVIETGSSGHLVLRLNDLTRISVSPDSNLHLAKIYFNAEDRKSYTGVRLERGRVRVAANPDRPGIAGAIFSYPGGALEMKSADFELEVDGPSAGHVQVKRGEAELSSGQAASLKLRAGTWTDLGAPASARPLIAAPLLIAPLTGVSPLPVELRWAPVAGALRYRVEVAEDVEFFQTPIDQILQGLTLAVPNLEPSRMWYWRVSAEREGEPSGLTSAIYAFSVGPAVGSPTGPRPATVSGPAPAPKHGGH